MSSPSEKGGVVPAVGAKGKRILLQTSGTEQCLVAFLLPQPHNRAAPPSPLQILRATWQDHSLFESVTVRAILWWLVQVLELGILVHSVIIGVSLGASLRPSTIRPLVGALSFHQFFEGIGLGGCIVQVRTSCSICLYTSH